MHFVASSYSFNILRKYVSSESEKRRIIHILLEQFETIPCSKTICEYSLTSDIDDYEDAIIEETAKIFKVDYLVTNNIIDFQNSKLEIISPKKLVLILDTYNS